MAVAKASVCPHSEPALVIFPTGKYGFHFQVREYQGSFSSYRYLWTDDRYKKKKFKKVNARCVQNWYVMLAFPRSEFMRQFLLYGHVLSTEEAELYADYELKKNPPTLDNFKDQVCVMLTQPSFSSYAEACHLNVCILLYTRSACSKPCMYG